MNIPFKMPNPVNLGRHTDVMFAIGAVMVIMMLIIPLPTMILDLLLVVNIVISLLILLMVLSIKSANDFSVFPSVLLIMTAFRLALNVSTTRAILSQGANFDGRVITAFANFVVSGNVVVGVVIFIILIIVQFIVITKGATRVSEVAARFALDSMPSKMMAVESELQAGAITDKEAEEKRKKIRGESDFYGTMDGASKFVQGDVIAGLIITVINIVGGLVIGMTMRGETFNQAIDVYTRFTIGDGLVTQIPAFFMSFATGLLVTRSSSEDNLSTQIAVQIFAKPKNLFIGAGFALFLMFLPGFPKIALFVISLALFFAGYTLKKEQKELGINEDGTKAETPEQTQQGPLDVTPLLKVEKVELSVGTSLIPLALESEGGDLINRISRVRRELALEIGLAVPPVRIVDNQAIEPDEYTISINGIEMAKNFVRPNMLLALNSESKEKPTEEAEMVKEPAFGLPAYWIKVDERHDAEQKKFTLFEPSTVIATHFSEIIKRNANLILGREEVQEMLDRIKDENKALVSEILAAKPHNESPLGYIQKVLQNLLQEELPIKNNIAILEGIADAISVMGSEQATELVRSRLSPQISQMIADADKNIKVITFSQQLQNNIAQNLVNTGNLQGSQMIAMGFESMQNLIKNIKDAIKLANESGVSEIIFLCSPAIRKPLYQFIAKNIGKYKVVSTAEIMQGYNVQGVAIIK
ncbi:flagellar type III secretion system protein FlhA [Brachyspira aalborgi]|uniref:Flagellar type III secretion system protein FlhA n=1 Tax=Brachyspira aalborgi TaxID=29522 RepID=A0A5C8GB42_9SPIR|nr:flagellar biosynthesis protein FlhA [Brachyspira aalborgi]TXJ46770.1 flagellar type III secretion system protein FlhA [Brachyspira aalborgi]TXJ59009.1 flagellar type III secretion system protein FlhA [Brachyspira aalborgi]